MRKEWSDKVRVRVGFLFCGIVEKIEIFEFMFNVVIFWIVLDFWINLYILLEVIFV